MRKWIYKLAVFVGALFAAQTQTRTADRRPQSSPVQQSVGPPQQHQSRVSQLSLALWAATIQYNWCCYSTDVWIRTEAVLWLLVGQPQVNTFYFHFHLGDIDQGGWRWGQFICAYYGAGNTRKNHCNLCTVACSHNFSLTGAIYVGEVSCDILTYHRLEGPSQNHHRPPQHKWRSPLNDRRLSRIVIIRIPGKAPPKLDSQTCITIFSTEHGTMRNYTPKFKYNRASSTIHPTTHPIIRRQYQQRQHISHSHPFTAIFHAQLLIN